MTDKCVRCGVGRRVGSAFVCVTCAADRRLDGELTAARDAHPGDARRQRIYLLTVGKWTGGWDVRR